MSSGLIENALIVYFMAFLVLDTCIGVIDYRETLRWDTTWLHHITYLIFTVYLVRMNATNSFMSYCICEIPTLILALGNIHPKWRHDRLFGYSFAATRLGYFFILSFIFWAATPVSETCNCINIYTSTLYSSHYPPPPPSKLIPFTISGFLIPVAFLHISWFKAWLSGQSRRATRRDDKLNHASTTSNSISSISTNSHSSSSGSSNAITSPHAVAPVDSAAIRPRIGSANIIEVRAPQQYASSSPQPPEEKVHAPPPHRARIGSGSGNLLSNSLVGVGVGVGSGSVNRSTILSNHNALASVGGTLNNENSQGGGGGVNNSPRLNNNSRLNKERNA